MIIRNELYKRMTRMTVGSLALITPLTVCLQAVSPASLPETPIPTSAPAALITPVPPVAPKEQNRQPEAISTDLAQKRLEDEGASDIMISPDSGIDPLTAYFPMIKPSDLTRIKDSQPVKVEVNLDQLKDKPLLFGLTAALEGVSIGEGPSPVAKGALVLLLATAAGTSAINITEMQKTGPANNILEVTLSRHALDHRGVELASYIATIVTAAFKDPNSQLKKKVLCTAKNAAENMVVLATEVISRGTNETRTAAVVFVQTSKGKWVNKTALYLKKDMQKFLTDQRQKFKMSSDNCGGNPPPTGSLLKGLVPATQ